MSSQHYDDTAAADYYADPEHRSPTSGEVVKPTPPQGEYLRVRVTAELLARIRRVAEADGRTTSSWVRRLITRELDRLDPPQTITGRDPEELGLEVTTDAAPLTTTLATAG